MQAPMFIKNIILISVIIVLSVCCFGSDDQAFMKQEIIADDGESFLLKQYDIKNTENELWVIKGHYQYFVQIFNERDNTLLAGFTFGYYNLSDHEGDYTLELKAVKDYENVTLYNLTITYTYDGSNNVFLIWGGRRFRTMDEYYKPYSKVGERRTDTLKIWIDKNDGRYSGSLIYRPVDLNISSFEGYEYYTAIQDMLLGLVIAEFDDFNNNLDNDEPHEIDHYLDSILKWISIYDSNTAEKLQKQLDTLKQRNLSPIWKQIALEMDERIVSCYSLPVSLIQEQLAGNIQHYGVAERPDIAGDIPKDEKELNVFKSWYASLYGRTDSVLSNAYGIPALFEIIENGLKVTSAGADKEFGNDDDIVYINGVKQTKND